MFVRSLRAAAALAVVALLASGCTGSPAPTPSTPTPLSEDEAYAAAEATYRAYVDALNQVDLSDPATFEPVYALTTGEANAGLRKSFSQMSADGWVVAGDSKISLVEGASFNEPTTSLAVCVDVSAVTVVDASGQSQVAPDRVPVQSMTVLVESLADSHRISSLEGRDGEPKCSS
ncbi:hypothetical protein ACIQLJ_07625 [Microbacterium sp. NPDC091313]